MQDVRARRPRELLPGPREGARPEDDPQVRAQVQAMMRAHFEQWPQMKLPGLGNRTALVLEAERGARRMDPPVEEAVLANLRRRLGLDQPGQ